MTLSHLSVADKNDEIKKVLNECYRYVGIHNPDKTDFEYLLDRLVNMAEYGDLGKLTVNELCLTIQSGLDQDPEFLGCGKTMTLKNIKCFIRKFFIIRQRYEFDNCGDEIANAREKMMFLYKNLDKMPAVKQWYEETKGKKYSKKEPQKISDIEI